MLGLNTVLVVAFQLRASSGVDSATGAATRMRWAGLALLGRGARRRVRPAGCPAGGRSGWCRGASVANRTWDLLTGLTNVVE